MLAAGPLGLIVELLVELLVAAIGGGPLGLLQLLLLLFDLTLLICQLGLGQCVLDSLGTDGDCRNHSQLGEFMQVALGSSIGPGSLLIGLLLEQVGPVDSGLNFA